MYQASSQGDRDHHEAVDHHAEAGVAVHVFEDPLVPVHGMTDEEIAKHHQAKWGVGPWESAADLLLASPYEKIFKKPKLGWYIIGELVYSWCFSLGGPKMRHDITI